MKLYIECEAHERTTSFSLAEAFYDLCKASFVDVEAVANMMLLECKWQREETSNDQ